MLNIEFSIDKKLVVEKGGIRVTNENGRERERKREKKNENENEKEKETDIERE